MPSISILLPGKQEPTHIVLRGARITIGRTARNTVQLLDRSVSSSHAELIEEDGHYRLHDVGSTNGTFVNGDQVTDFHLRESCKLSFGTLECNFRAEAVVEKEPGAETLVTRSEFDALVADRERLTAELETLRREREQLQRSWDAAKEGIATLRHQLAESVATPAAAPAASAPRVPVPVAKPATPAPASTPRVVTARPAAAPGSAVTARPASPTALPRPVVRPAKAGDTRKLTP